MPTEHQHCLIVMKRNHPSCLLCWSILFQPGGSEGSESGDVFSTDDDLPVNNIEEPEEKVKQQGTRTANVHVLCVSCLVFCHFPVRRRSLTHLQPLNISEMEGTGGKHITPVNET